MRFHDLIQVKICVSDEDSAQAKSIQFADRAHQELETLKYLNNKARQIFAEPSVIIADEERIE
jgi:uncharacterized protein YfcZ (UPF0381/DUF406 family)